MPDLDEIQLVAERKIEGLRSRVNALTDELDRFEDEVKRTLEEHQKNEILERLERIGVRLSAIEDRLSERDAED